MKTLLYLLALVLSLPNLLAGLALAVLQHSFVSRNPLLIILNFFEAVFWAIPVSAAVIIILVMASFFSETRVLAALATLLLNAAALVIVILRFGPPHDLAEAAIFAPVMIALALLGWLVRRGYVSVRATDASD